jgi:hypothetical protein
MNKPPRLDLGASSASRWTVCTASPQFILENHHRIPENRDTAYSLEGTLAHAVCEALLTSKPTPLGATAEMERHAQSYRDFCRTLSAPGAAEFVETKVPLWYYPGRNAIVDYASVTTDQVTIIDYKYGAGVPVDSYENKQMAIYARCFIETVVLGLGTHDITDDTKIVMAIYQPRCHRDEPDVAWMMTWADLVEWTDEKIGCVADEIRDPNHPWLPIDFAPSDKTCQFCPASGFCTARAQHLLGDLAPLDMVLTQPEQVVADPSAVTVGLAPPDALDETHLLAALAVAKSVGKWLDSIEAYAQNLAADGRPLPGWKLVEGRGSRQWADEEAAAKFLKPKLKENTFEKKLVSVAQAEKLLKHEPLSPRFKNKLESLIVRREGKPTLVPENDKRPSLMAAANDFQQLTDDL